MDATLQGKEGSDSGEQSVGARCVKEACKSLALNGLHKLSVLQGPALYRTAGVLLPASRQMLRSGGRGVTLAIGVCFRSLHAECRTGVRRRRCSRLAPFSLCLPLLAHTPLPASF